jgi:hypothetical protein
VRQTFNETVTFTQTNQSPTTKGHTQEQQAKYKRPRPETREKLEKYRDEKRRGATPETRKKEETKTRNNRDETSNE